MDFQQLKTLQKLHKEKSFSRTSKELGISQPTVTTRIKSLEEELGENLVLRTGQKAILTESGKRFLSYADRALQVYQFGIDRLATNEKTISIAATPTISTYILPDKLKEARKKDPELKWKFITATSMEILQMMKDEIVDLGLIGRRLDDKEVNCHPILLEEFFLVVSADHPFANQKAINLKQLQNENIIVYRKSSKTYKHIHKTFENSEVPLNLAMEVEHVITAKQMVLAGLGVAFLPESAMIKEIEHNQLVKIEIQDTQIIREISIISSKENISPVSSYVLDLLKDIFKK